jgi:hypothetical protein
MPPALTLSNSAFFNTVDHVMAQAVNRHPLIEGPELNFIGVHVRCMADKLTVLHADTTLRFSLSLSFYSVPCLRTDPSPTFFNLSNCLHR